MGTQDRGWLRVASLLLLCCGAAPSQASREAVLSIVVLDDRGKPVEKETTFVIEGDDFYYKAIVRTRGSVPLPFGAYTVKGGGRERRVEIRQPRTQLVITIPPGRSNDDDSPWIIRGRIVPAPGKQKIVVARLVGLYLNEIEDVVADEDGSFALYVWEPSQYKLWILMDGNRVAERDVKIELLPKELPLIEIRVPQEAPRK